MKTITIPMDKETLKEFHLNKGKEVFEVDYKGSLLKGAPFISFISNMVINCQLKEDKELSPEEKSDLLAAYLDSNIYTPCPTLLDTLACASMVQKGMELAEAEKYLNVKSWMDSEEVIYFLQSERELMGELEDFLSNAMTSVMSFSIPLKEGIIDAGIESGEIELVNDPNVLAPNVLGLFTYLGLIEFIVSVSDNSKMKYYKYHVEQMQYNQKTLFEIVMDNESPLLAMIHVLTNQDQEEEKKVLEMIIGDQNDSLNK